MRCSLFLHPLSSVLRPKKLKQKLSTNQNPEIIGGLIIYGVTYMKDASKDVATKTKRKREENKWKKGENCKSEKILIITFKRCFSFVRVLLVACIFCLREIDYVYFLSFLVAVCTFYLVNEDRCRSIFLRKRYCCTNKVKLTGRDRSPKNKIQREEQEE